MHLGLGRCASFAALLTGVSLLWSDQACAQRCHGGGGGMFFGGSIGAAPAPIMIMGMGPMPMLPPNYMMGPGPSGFFGMGLMLPSPNIPNPAPINQPVRRPVARRPNAARRTELTTIGDRLFRAKNFKRAEERYLQAIKADPNSAAPRVRLALLALERGQFSEAAEQFRTAQLADPSWLFEPEDIEKIYAEPGDFGKVLSKLETHVQAHPNDRDAWLALGAGFFLSGRVQRSHDIFVRLADRKPDETLAAFLDASAPAASETPKTEDQR